MAKVWRRTIAWKAKIIDFTQKSQTVDLKKEKIFAQHPRPEHLQH